MGKAARSGGGAGGRQKLKAAGRAYVSAKGGARRAAVTARAGVVSTAGLGGFLADVARGGFGEALRRNDLAEYVGRDAETVFAALVNKIASHGATAEDAAARSAVREALSVLYDREDLFSGDFSRLDSLEPSTIREVVETGVAAYVYNRWLHEVGIKIEERSRDVGDAARLEADVKDYVRESVRAAFRNLDVVSLDWSSPSTTTVIEGVFADTYTVFESAS